MEDQYNTRATLLYRVKEQRDEDSWSEFVQFYKQYIYLICRRMELNHHDAEDVVQSVIIKLWDKLPSFNYDYNKCFRAWLSVITANMVRDFLRKKQRKPVMDQLEGEYCNNSFAITQSEIEEIAEEEWQNYVMTLAMNKIKEQFSEKIINIFHELNKGSSLTKVSEIYDLPPNTISVYKRRIMRALTKEIYRLEETIG